MRRISLSILLIGLAGCTTTGSGSMNAPGRATVSYPTVYNTKALYNSVDVKAINEAIAAGNRQYWAPEDEVLQQSMDHDLRA